MQVIRTSQVHRSSHRDRHFDRTKECATSSIILLAAHTAVTYHFWLF